MSATFQLSVAGYPKRPCTSPSRSVHWFLYALIILGSVVRAHEIWVHNPIDLIFSDTQRYWDHAKEPLTPSPLAIFDPPVYQIWISIVQRLTQGIPVLVAIYAAALSIITPWCWYGFLRETVASRTLALTGWALLSLVPTWIGCFSFFMSETLFLPLVGLSLWMTARAGRKRTVQSFSTMVFIWTLTALTRGIAIPLAGVAGLLVWLVHPHKIKTILASIVVAGSMLAPLSYRNYHFFGLWEPWGNGWINKIYAESGAREIHMTFSKSGPPGSFGVGCGWVYGFGSPSIGTYPFAPFSNWTSQRHGTVFVDVDLAHGPSDWKAVWQSTRIHGAERWRLRWENLAFLFFGNSWPDNNEEFWMDHIENQSRWIWAPLFLGLVGLGLWRWQNVLERPLLPAVIAIWFLFQAWLLIVPNEGRYRKPAEGMFVVQAMVFADQIIGRRRKAPIANPVVLQPTESAVTPAATPSPDQPTVSA